MKKLFNGLETDYLDGFQYKFTHSWEDPSGTMTSDEMKLRIIPTSEGYFDALRNRYFYNYTDHLGNVRLSYSDANGNNEVTGDIVVNNCVDTPDGQMCNNYIITGEAEGVTNYYPFGMIHNGEYNNFENAYQNKYNGKELQETGMYDYGARFYMPDLGRWGVVDPLAEIARRFTPYHYGNNNPVRFIDPDGRSTQTFTGGDIQNAFYQFYFSGSVSKVTGGNSFGSSGGDDVPMFYNDEAGMIMTSALGNDGQGGGSSLSPWMQNYLGISPALAGVYAHAAMSNFFNNNLDFRENWFSEKNQSIWKWDLKMRPDLHYMSNGINSVWELKPMSHFMESSLSLKGQYQAQGYADALTMLKHEKFFVGSSQGAPIPPVNGRVLSYSGYQFIYNVPIGTDGMIYYNCLNCNSPVREGVRETQQSPKITPQTVNEVGTAAAVTMVILSILVRLIPN